MNERKGSVCHPDVARLPVRERDLPADHRSVDVALGPVRLSRARASAATSHEAARTHEHAHEAAHNCTYSHGRCFRGFDRRAPGDSLHCGRRGHGAHLVDLRSRRAERPPDARAACAKRPHDRASASTAAAHPCRLRLAQQRGQRRLEADVVGHLPSAQPRRRCRVGLAGVRGGVRACLLLRLRHILAGARGVRRRRPRRRRRARRRRERALGARCLARPHPARAAGSLWQPASARGDVGALDDPTCAAAATLA